MFWTYLIGHPNEIMFNVGTFWDLYIQVSDKICWFIELLRFSKSAFWINPLTVHFKDFKKLVQKRGQKLKFLYKSMYYSLINISWWIKVVEQYLVKRHPF